MREEKILQDIMFLFLIVKILLKDLLTNQYTKHFRRMNAAIRIRNLLF